MPDKIEFSLNIKGVADEWKAIGNEIRQALSAELYKIANEVMTESKRDYVPVRTGALRSTGTVLPPEVENNQLVVRLGYGGVAAPYALAVHETDKNYRHGKQWKYLETPLMAKVGGGIEDRLRNAVISKIKPIRKK